LTSKLRTHKHTNPQNSTLTDNKGPLKLSAREPTERHTKGGTIKVLGGIETYARRTENLIVIAAVTV